MVNLVSNILTFARGGIILNLATTFLEEHKLTPNHTLLSFDRGEAEVDRGRKSHRYDSELCFWSVLRCAVQRT